jgi:hypothetical protein
MYKVIFTQEQIKSLLALLDLALKTDGLNVLSTIVDLHNAINSAQQVQNEGSFVNETD